MQRDGTVSVAHSARSDCGEGLTLLTFVSQMFLGNSSVANMLLAKTKVNLPVLQLCRSRLPALLLACWDSPANHNDPDRRAMGSGLVSTLWAGVWLSAFPP